MHKDLSISNPNPVKLPGPELLHHLIQRHGKDNAPAIDFLFADGSRVQVSYDEMHHQANALAHRILAAKERNPVDSSTQRFAVPIWINQCPELYISEVATLKAGGAFCPISLEAPADRLRFILKDVGARLLLTTERLEPQLPKLDGIEVIVVDDGTPVSNSSDPEVPVTPEQTAYILYTSGSTGLPKGVVISHLAVSQAFLAHDRGIRQFTRFLQFANPTFDLSILDVFFPLFRGVTMVGCERKHLINNLAEVIVQMKVDGVELTPSVVAGLLSDHDEIPGLKVVITAGEMIKPVIVEKFGDSPKSPGILQGLYGPTETTIHCTGDFSFKKDMPCSNIGFTFETTSTYVIKFQEDDDTTEPVVEVLPKGEMGEIAIGGYQLADGYLNRPEKNKSVFINHPQYGALYRTGDRGIMRQDERLEFHGRIANGQVKIRGQRIELGEIEYAASRASGCRDAAAESIDGTLVLFCLADPSVLNKATVLDACRTWLPAYMLPQEVVISSEFPYSTSYKLDRNILRQKWLENRSVSNGVEEPLDDRMKTILATISRVLKTEVHPNSILQNIGLDSLSCIRLAVAFQRDGFPRPNAAQLLITPTARDVRSLLDAAESPPAAEANDELAATRERFRSAVQKTLTAEQMEDVGEVLPVTVVQNMILGSSLRFGLFHNNWAEFRVPANHHITDIEQTVRDVCKHHQILRGGFVHLPELDPPFAYVVWKNYQPDFLKKVDEFNRKGPISENQPFLRPINFEYIVDKDGWRLMLRLHHAAYDVWSTLILRDDMQALLDGRPMEPAPGFDEVARYQAKHLPEASSETAAKFWLDYLHGYVPTHFPKVSGPDAPHTHGVSDWTPMPFNTVDMRAKAKELGVSSATVFQAIFTMVLGHYAAADEVSFGLVFSGRVIPVAGVERVFGPCLTTMPFRLSADKTQTCTDLLATVGRINRGMEKWFLSPSDLYKERIGMKSTDFPFHMVFVWQETTLESTEDSLEMYLNASDHDHFEMVIEFEPHPTKLLCRIRHRLSVISAPQVDILLGQVKDLLVKLVATPSAQIKDLTTDMSLEV